MILIYFQLHMQIALSQGGFNLKNLYGELLPLGEPTYRKAKKPSRKSIVHIMQNAVSLGRGFFLSFAYSGSPQGDNLLLHIFMKCISP